jgi:RHS repeat-associated protein
MAWTTSYYHYDGLGSTRQLTDSSENVTDTYLYDAWGESLLDPGPTPNPFRWVGRMGYYYDSAPALYYVRARMFDFATGRWRSQDPLYYPLAMFSRRFVMYSRRRVLLETGHDHFRSVNYEQPRSSIFRAAIAHEQSHWNLYQYVNNRPIIGTDPDGEKFSCLICFASLCVEATIATSCAATCISEGHWDVPGESFGSCWKKCMWICAPGWASTAGGAVSSCIICLAPVPTP